MVKEETQCEQLKTENIKKETGLTERELTIIKEIAKGVSNKEIGEKMF